MLLQTCWLLLIFVFKVEAFWWQPTTTETPAINVKHIPLTYFRTYTYQPLTGGPFTFPFNFGGAPQTPLLNGGRYEHYTYPTSQQFHSGPFGPQPPPPPPTATTAASTTSTPTTTTTTTTTPPPPPPPPPTTTTTTTTSTTTTTKAPMPAHQQSSIINSGGGTYGPAPPYDSSIYPTYNRRLYMSQPNMNNYYRPNYPYPASLLSQQRSPHVQFVPCMCPVSVGVPSGLPIVGGGGNGINMNMVNPAQNLYMPQARSNDGAGDDADMELPLDDAADEADADADADADGDAVRGKSNHLSETISNRMNDEAFLNDDIQSLETNHIDSSHRQSKELLTLSTNSP